MLCLHLILKKPRTNHHTNLQLIRKIRLKFLCYNSNKHIWKEPCMRWFILFLEWTVTVLWDTVIGAIWSCSCVILDTKICINQILEKYNQWLSITCHTVLNSDGKMSRLGNDNHLHNTVQCEKRKLVNSQQGLRTRGRAEGWWLGEMIALPPLQIFVDNLALFYSGRRLCPPY